MSTARSAGSPMRTRRFGFLILGPLLFGCASSSTEDTTTAGAAVIATPSKHLRACQVFAAYTKLIIGQLKTFKPTTIVVDGVGVVDIVYGDDQSLTFYDQDGAVLLSAPFSVPEGAPIYIDPDREDYILSCARP